MTIAEAITRIDTLKPNAYSREDKIHWLSKLDGQIYEEVFKTHKGIDKQEEIDEYIKNDIIEQEKQLKEYALMQGITIEEAKKSFDFRKITYAKAKEHIESTRNDIMFSGGYDADTPDVTELLVPAPYDELYLTWLESRIDYFNGEYNKYNASITMFDTAYRNFTNYYNRTHKPVSTAKFRYF